MTSPSLLRPLQLALVSLSLISAALIAACGGAIGSGGTGAAPPAVSGGTVTGFGSVIIDGLRFDDRSVVTVAEPAPGSEVLAEARMGHRVEVEFDADGNTRALRVEASVVGQVTAVSVTGVQAGVLIMIYVMCVDLLAFLTLAKLLLSASASIKTSHTRA